MAKRGTKQSITKKAPKRFERWDANKTPLYNKDGDLLVLKEDEEFTMLYDYRGGAPGTNKETRFNPRYYVSNYGNIISFSKVNSDEPELLLNKTNASKKEKDKKRARYIKAGGWYVHKVVYLSFVMREEKVLDKLSKQEFSYKDINHMEVHHIDHDRRNNVLSNLQGLNGKVHKELISAIGNRYDENAKTKNYASEEEYVKEILTKKMQPLNDLHLNKGESFMIPDAKETAVIQTRLTYTDKAEADRILFKYGKFSHEVIREAVKEIGRENFIESKNVAIRYDGARVDVCFKTTVINNQINIKQVYEEGDYIVECVPPSTEGMIPRMYVSSGDENYFIQE